MSLEVAVLGAGVVGLTVARLLQQESRNANVTVLAEKFQEDTVSAVAAGLFRPGTSFRGTSRAVTKRWIDDSWYHWQEILKSPDAPTAGVMQLSSYIFSKDNYHITRNHLIEDLVPIYRELEGKELKLCPGDWKYGSYFSTLKVECTRYLPWCEKRFLENGGKMTNMKIDNFRQLSKYDMVFNCAGLGAKYLCGDHDLVPLRGQVIKVKAPWLKTAFYADYDTYIIPGSDGMATLGGVRQYDSYNLNVCQYDAAAILDRCCQLLPALKKAPIFNHKVGLRPHRVPVRVEPELMDGQKVVHCYGHGGYGVMCAPGTAMDAVKYGLDFLKINTRNKL